MQPCIFVPGNNEGYHNGDYDRQIGRIEDSQIYKDLSTIIITPTRGQIHPRHSCAMGGLIRPFNQKIIGPIHPRGLEVGAAYNLTIQGILDDPQMSKFKYILTVEDDMLPPMDGIIRLCRNIGDYDMIGGLYWTKGENGLPLMFGDASNSEENYLPVLPIANTVQPVYGCGMGFNLWNMDLFRKVPGPWFETVAEIKDGQPLVMTQDISFFKKANKLGCKFAIDTSCRCGHMDSNEVVW